MAVTVGCRSVESAAHVDPRGGEVIVFVQPGASDVDRAFQSDPLPKIRAMATEMGAALRVIDARKGAPPEVKLTPLIVYQNDRGRSIYQGRYSTLDRVRTFLRTARFVPQGDGSLERRDTPVWRSGRTQIAASLKIAPVEGRAPANYEVGEFTEQSLDTVRAAFEKFRMTDRVELGRSDRLFYMDFYPWLSQDDELYVSLRLFSQFHCKKPIYSTADTPLHAPWSQRSRLFTAAAAKLEAALFERLDEADTGDGFDPLASTCPIKSWEALGLALPVRPPESDTPSDAGQALVRDWRVARPQADAAPEIQFRFAPPFDGYSGEVKSAGGELHLTSDLRFNGAQARFTANPASVTMGEPDLDDALRGSALLDVRRFPSSSFTVERFASDGALEYGQPISLIMYGRFELKGVTIPRSARAVFEPFADDNGRPRLLMQASFQLNITPFDLEGPDGDPPASETLLLDVNMILEPAESGPP